MLFVTFMVSEVQFETRDTQNPAELMEAFKELLLLSFGGVSDDDEHLSDAAWRKGDA